MKKNCLKPNRASNLLIAGLLIVFLSGCAELDDMLKIRSELVRQYNHKNISINIKDSKNMTVIFFNSPFGVLGETERRAKANEIAVFCVSLFNEASRIENLSIIFMKHERKFFIADYTQTIAEYPFKVSDLKKILLQHKIRDTIIHSIH